MENNQLFKNIAGYDDVKHELLEIYSWYKDKTLVNNKDIRLPKGILFYGNAGNGKTLFIREFVKAINAKSFSIEGLAKDVNKEIHDTFAKARKEPFALVLIDEIDLLMNKDYKAERTLLAELDGLNTEGHVLVLATSNKRVYELPEPLTRQGRFDRAIKISNPGPEEIIELFKFNLSNLKVDYSDIGLTHLSNLCRFVCCSDIKSIVNDAYLRSKTSITTRDLEKSYERLINRNYSNVNPIKYRQKKVAIHEAGHSIMAMRFSKDFRFFNAKFDKEGGVTNTYPINSLEDTLEKRLERVQIVLAGAMAEKIFYKKHDVGSFSDFDKAHDLIRGLIERTCCVSLEDFHRPSYGAEGQSRTDTEIHQNANEKHAWKILKKQSKLAYKYLKKHKAEVEKFANMLYEKGEINLHDLEGIQNEIDNEPITYSYIPKKAFVLAQKNKN